MPPILVCKSSGMQDFRNFQHLLGSLGISKIDDVRDALDMKEANLKQKQ